MHIGNREIGKNVKPLVIADVGINHGGDFDRARYMIEDAAEAGCECIKFQCHIPESEMLKKECQDIIPVNADESIYDIMEKCSFSEEQEKKLKGITEENGMIYLNTPFSKEAVDRLERIGVVAYKIGSGECNNYPLVEYIAQKKKPIILSTGMNNLRSVERSVKILKKYNVEFALLHCTSLYPTPHDKVRLQSMRQLELAFDCLVGWSDHTLDNYSCYGAVALGASIIEKHFTYSKRLKGPDISISMGFTELKQMLEGSKAIFEARDGKKEILEEEKNTIKFAYASVVSIQDVKRGERFTENNIWVKRPGTGQIKAEHYDNIIGMISLNDIEKNQFIQWNDIYPPNKEIK